MSIPRCPRLVCGEAEFEGSLPTRAHLPRRGAGVGGSETAAGGRPASYSVREDHLLIIPMRIPEEEWAEFESFIDLLMEHTEEVDFFRDAEDVDPQNSCWLESPKRGEEWGPDRTSEMADEFEMTIILRSVTGPWDGRFFSVEEEES